MMTPTSQHTDPRVLLHALDQDIDAFISLSNTFLDITPPMLDRLQAAVAASQPAEIALESHTLKNTLALVGAKALANCLQEIEIRAHQGIANGYGDLIKNLPEQIQQVQQEVRDHIRHYTLQGKQS
ncbi:Hpt domain-containing protein [uncultured Oxalicibacterium sp.]|uniref:Hpt domain-containing protein n=1 Tax=uncultured Oxalicibacterium sp. TaxID=1168540 RepID=UPI0025FE0966|nr:Hpt domain-containing protein [uncultured Oxalicibacterium sp.]